MPLPPRLLCDTSFFYACFDRSDANHRRGFREALTFLTEIRPHLHIVNYGESVRTEAEQIFRQYGRDHRLSFCDAISFVVVTTLLDHMPCLAFDEDFRALGLAVIP